MVLKKNNFSLKNVLHVISMVSPSEMACRSKKIRDHFFALIFSRISLKRATHCFFVLPGTSSAICAQRSFAATVAGTATRAASKDRCCSIDQTSSTASSARGGGANSSAAGFAGSGFGSGLGSVFGAAFFPFRCSCISLIFSTTSAGVRKVPMVSRCFETTSQRFTVPPGNLLKLLASEDISSWVQGFASAFGSSAAFFGAEGAVAAAAAAFSAAISRSAASRRAAAAASVAASTLPGCYGLFYLVHLRLDGEGFSRNWFSTFEAAPTSSRFLSSVAAPRTRIYRSLGLEGVSERVQPRNVEVAEVQRLPAQTLIFLKMQY